LLSPRLAVKAARIGVDESARTVNVFGRANAPGRSNPNNFLFDHDILWIVNDILEALEPWEAV